MTLVGRRVVEVAGRLVAEQHSRVVGERADDRDALLLAAREPRRAVVARAAPGQPGASGGGGLLACPGRGAMQADELRQRRVFERRKFGQQVMELVDETEVGAAQQRARARRTGRRNRSPRNQHRPAVRAFKQPGDVQQGGLARARRADQGHDLSRLQCEVDAVEHDDLGTAALEDAADPA